MARGDDRRNAVDRGAAKKAELEPRGEEENGGSTEKAVGGIPEGTKRGEIIHFLP